MIVQPVVEPMDRFAALLISNQQPESSGYPAQCCYLLSPSPSFLLVPVSGSILTMSHNGQCPVCQCPRPMSPLCLLCNLAAGQDQDGEPELGTQHRHRAPAGTQLGSQHSSSGSWDDHIEWVSNILAWLLVPFGND